MQPAFARTDIKDLSDAEIAQRVAAGDRVVFTALMRRYNQTLYRTARSILKDEAEAEDAVQEAYLLAYRGIGKFRAESKLSTWLVRIVVNEAIGRRRKQTRRAEVIWLNGDIEVESETSELESMTDPFHEQPDGAASRAETRRLIEASIDKLPDAFRSVFVLRGVEEFSVEETALALGIPSATVRTRYFRARALLRESLAREIDTSIDTAFSFAGERCNRIVAGVLARLPAQ